MHGKKCTCEGGEGAASPVDVGRESDEGGGGGAVGRRHWWGEGGSARRLARDRPLGLGLLRVSPLARPDVPLVLRRLRLLEVDQHGQVLGGEKVPGPRDVLW